MGCKNRSKVASNRGFPQQVPTLSVCGPLLGIFWSFGDQSGLVPGSACDERRVFVSPSRRQLGRTNGLPFAREMMRPVWTNSVAVFTSAVNSRW